MHFIAPDKLLFLPKITDIFYVFQRNCMLWYTLEAPRRGASNEYHNIRFHGEISKQYY